MFDFKRITLFCFQKRLSKHKLAICSKNLGGHDPFAPLTTPMCHNAFRWIARVANFPASLAFSDCVTVGR